LVKGVEQSLDICKSNSHKINKKAKAAGNLIYNTENLQVQRTGVNVLKKAPVDNLSNS
jgi:hypothetical protein